MADGRLGSPSSFSPTEQCTVERTGGGSVQVQPSFNRVKTPCPL